MDVNPRAAELKALSLKAKVGPFNRQAAELHKFLFLARSAQALHMNEKTFILFVLRRDAGEGKKSLVDVEVHESEQRGAQTAGSVVPGANVDVSALQDFSLSNDKNR